MISMLERSFGRRRSSPGEHGCLRNPEERDARSVSGWSISHTLGRPFILAPELFFAEA